MKDSNRNQQGEQRLVPPWFQVIGAIFGAITLIFLAVLLIMSMFGWDVPANSKYIFCAFFALGAGLSTAFLGADAAAKGNVPLPFAPAFGLEIAVGGGVAVVIIVFLISIWALGSQTGPNRGPVAIQRSLWQPRNCDWAFKGPSADTLRTVGPNFTAKNWYETEPAGQINCEILYGMDLDPPYRVIVTVLPMNGEGKGGLIFDDDGGGFSYFEVQAKKKNVDGKVVFWKNNPFRGVALEEIYLEFNNFATIKVDVFPGKTFFYYNDREIYSQETINGARRRVGLRSAWSIIEFSQFSISRL